MLEIPFSTSPIEIRMILWRKVWHKIFNLCCSQIGIGNPRSGYNHVPFLHFHWIREFCRTRKSPKISQGDCTYALKIPIETIRKFSESCCILNEVRSMRLLQFVKPLKGWNRQSRTWRGCEVLIINLHRSWRFGNNNWSGSYIFLWIFVLNQAYSFLF